MPETGEPDRPELLGIFAEFHGLSGEQAELTARIERLGGTVVKAGTIYIPELPAQSKTESLAPELIHREAFEDAAHEAGIKADTAFSIWKLGQKVCKKVGENESAGTRGMPPEDFVSLNLVTSYLRSVEAGGPQIYRFGQSAWNFFAALINSRLPASDVPPPFQGWDNEVHPRLSNTVTGVTARAILEGRYKALQRIFQSEQD
jgi:hypothetical protein